MVYHSMPDEVIAQFSAVLMCVMSSCVCILLCNICMMNQKVLTSQAGATAKPEL